MSPHARFFVPLLLLPACRAQDSAPGAASAASSAPVVRPEEPATLPSATETDRANGTKAASGVAPVPAASAAGSRSWSFDDGGTDAAPSGFAFGRTGDGREGKWVVRSDPTAPSGSQVLAQVDADKTDDRFPIAFATEPTLKDLELSVRCKPISGTVDQACGLVFRLKDARNYYVTRANALENNVRLYVVKDGRRQQLASWSGKVTAKAWHEYRVVVRGDHIEVFWDAAKVLDHHDDTFSDAGKVGVWTKADSVTHFDDLRVEPLG
jgi:hypothetical protein